jgi:hypothetical protein
MNLKTVICLSLLLTGCTEMAFITSGTGIAVSHNSYAKAYSSIDFLTIINTEKDIKTHIYENVRHAD